MITLKKVTYCVGIGVTLSLFVLFLYAALPGMIQNSNWDNLDLVPLGEEGMLKKFQEDPTYAAFYERFPDAKEKLNYNKRSAHSSMEVGIRNFETGAELKLQLNYNSRGDDINANINCNIKGKDIDRSNLSAHGLFVLDFIEQTDCLELEGTIINTEFFPPPKIVYGPNDSTLVTIQR